MEIIIFRTLILYLIIGHYHGEGSSVCKTERKCTITRAHKMKAADCYDRQFKNFPKCLENDVEVIDLSFNRIRKVSRSDLSQFKYLKFLYLSDNMINNLDDDTFQDSEDLTTLDLSLNDLFKLPSTIFQLPSLKTLYLSQNQNMNIVDMMLVLNKPILSPLVQIDLSYTTCGENISEFPNFGLLPFLIQLNISGNQYSTMTPRDLMGFCNLQILINDNVTTGFDDACDCWKINHWLTEKKARFSMFPCTVEKAECLYSDFKEEDLAIHDQCRQLYEDIQRQYKIWKVSIGVGITAVVLIVLVILCCVAYKKKWLCKKKTKKSLRADAPDHLGLILNNRKSIPNEYHL
ncbi:unnamed protein product [Phaedon cochleariae]|uniref:Uncharacterized protein n=1 Tax=Phaedon cochleariae TaxID=80249 RepID=A0A9P0DLB3_PHACE|nr:unnamed protein product [Phaedon cochleariae]